MTTAVILPKWGLTMEDATLVEWLKKEGDSVDAGEVLAELETEKITNELESPVSGILRQIIIPAGTEEIEVGTILCIIDEVDGD